MSTATASVNRTIRSPVPTAQKSSGRSSAHSRYTNRKAARSAVTTSSTFIGARGRTGRRSRRTRRRGRRRSGGPVHRSWLLLGCLRVGDPLDGGHEGLERKRLGQVARAAEGIEPLRTDRGGARDDHGRTAGGIEGRAAE